MNSLTLPCINVAICHDQWRIDVQEMNTWPEKIVYLGNDYNAILYAKFVFSKTNILSLFQTDSMLWYVW